MFSSKSFRVSGPTFRSLIHFIFVHGVRKCSNFFLSHAAVQFSQHHLLKRLSLPHCILLPPVSKLRSPQVQRFISGLSVLFHWSVFVFVPVPYCLDSSFVVSPEVRKLDSSSSIFFLKTALAIWGLLCFHTNCEIFCSSSVKNAIGNLVGIGLNP